MVAHRTAARVQEVLRLKLYDKITELGPAWFAGERTGGVMLSVVDGVEQLQTFFGQYVPQLAIAALTPLAMFAIIAWWDVPVAAVMLCFALVCLVLPALFNRLNAESQHRASRFAENVRRRVSRRHPGPGDAQGVRPEHGLWSHAGRQGARAVRRDDEDAGDQPDHARHHRCRHRRRRRGGAGARRLSRSPTA